MIKAEVSFSQIKESSVHFAHFQPNTFTEYEYRAVFLKQWYKAGIKLRYPKKKKIWYSTLNI